MGVLSYGFLCLSQGNKGAVAIRFRFHNSDICVVNSHLAAHIEEFERRNQDFRDICSRLQFRQFDPTRSPLTIMKHEWDTWNSLHAVVMFIRQVYEAQCKCKMKSLKINFLSNSIFWCPELNKSSDIGSALLFLTSIILWIGDLNYRISELDVDNVKELISKKDFETLLNYDQVTSVTLSSLFLFNILRALSSHVCEWRH